MVSRSLLIMLAVGLLSVAASADGPSVTQLEGSYFSVTVDQAIVIRISNDLETWSPFETIIPTAPPQPGSRAALGVIGGRRHLYYCREDGSIGHLVESKVPSPPGTDQWKDDGRVVEFGSDPSVVIDSDGAAWLYYRAGATMTAVGLGTETGRVAVPLRTRSGFATGSYCVFRHRDGVWFLRTEGRWLYGRRVRAAADAPWFRMGVAAPDETLSGVISRGDGAVLAVSTPKGLACRPLLWLPDGGPAADDPGTLAAWTGTEPDAGLIPGPWLHQADDQRPGWLTFSPDGQIPDEKATWSRSGSTLTLTWPRPDAPGGAWLDRCLVSSDGTRYLGRNQNGNLIRGETTTVERGLGWDQPAHPLSRLPARVKAEAGKLSLFVDFTDVRGDLVVAYLVNRSGKEMLLPTQDGNPIVLLEGQAGDGTWERAESHQWSDCGNSYMITPALPLEHFFRVLVLYPGEGEVRQVRYHCHYLLDLVSNAGPGRVDPAAIELCRTDRIGINEGTFEQVAAIALGQTEILAKDYLDLRVHAIQRLRRFAPEKWRPVYKILLDDPDPKIRELAKEKLR